MFWAEMYLSKLHPIYLYISVCVIGFFVHARSLFFDFTYFDDNVLVLNNLPFLQNIQNVFTSFSQEVFHVLHSSAAYYRPILTISFMPDAMIGGSSPFMYHFTNVALHLIATAALLKLFLTLRYSRTLSVFLVMVFTVHPVLSQAVAWIPGRNDSLLTIFVVISFTAFVHYLDGRSLRSLFLSCIFFALAIFTKETALLLSGICILYLFLHAEYKRKVLISPILGWACIGAVWVFLRQRALVNPIPMTSSDMVQSVWNNLPAFIQLLGKAFFPFNLSVLPIIQDTSFVWGILASLIMGALFVHAILSRRGKSLRMVVFGFIWFGAFLLPSFIRPNPTIVADFIEHRLYLPLVGLGIILAESDIWRHVRESHQSLLMIFAGGILMVFVGITFIHESNFSNRMTFWTNAATTSPHSPLAQRNLGAMYYLAGDIDMAEQYYLKSLVLNKNEQMVNNNLGLIYAKRGENLKAEEAYKRELAINPFYDNVHYNLGLLYYQLGRVDEAKELWQKTLQINPDYEDAHIALDASKSAK